MSTPNDNKPSPVAIEQVTQPQPPQGERTHAEYFHLLGQFGALRDQRDALQAQRDELLAMLERARQDINWMLNNRQFLNGHVFEYIDAAIARATEGGKK